MFCTFKDDFSEELLTAHEQEEHRLKQNYEHHKELYNGVANWQNDWVTYQELEVRYSDSDAVFSS